MSAPTPQFVELNGRVLPAARATISVFDRGLLYAGNAVFNLAIRTAVGTPEKVTYHAGGGIVADSVPLREYEETLLKAQPFFAALHATSAAVDQFGG